MLLTMKKWPLFTAIVLFALGLWLVVAKTGSQDRDEDESPGQPDTKTASRGTGAAAIDRSTKSATRQRASLGPATHSPERLGEFQLPPIEINGLSLAAALEKLRGAYHLACRDTGESPVPLEFVIPPGKDTPIHLKLAGRNLDDSIRLLAAVAGLQVERDGADYRFEEVSGDEVARARAVRVSPDILHRLATMAGRDFPEGSGVKERLEALGLDLDPATSVSFNAGTSTVLIESRTAADLNGIPSFFEILFDGQPLQHKLETQVIGIPAGTDWTPPDSATLDEAGLQRLLADLSSMDGVKLVTNPAVTTRGGQTATVEIAGDPASGKISHVLSVTPDVLGFGEMLDVTYTDTERSMDPASGRVVLKGLGRIDFAGFTGTGDTRVKVQKHPDGSRTVLLVTPTLIDGTGRPVHRTE